MLKHDYYLVSRRGKRVTFKPFFATELLREFKHGAIRDLPIDEPGLSCSVVAVRTRTNFGTMVGLRNGDSTFGLATAFKIERADFERLIPALQQDFSIAGVGSGINLTVLSRKTSEPLLFRFGSSVVYVNKEFIFAFGGQFQTGGALESVEQCLEVILSLRFFFWGL